MLVVPATWDVEIGGSWFETTQGKNERPYLKNKLKMYKDWGHGSSGSPESNPLN
jgi:hypothetical protein